MVSYSIEETTISQAFHGPFIRQYYQTIETVNSFVYIFPSHDLVVKQRKIRECMAPYGSLTDAMADQERLRRIRKEFIELMPEDTPPEVLPEVMEVIHNPPGSLGGVCVSWITPLVDCAETISSLSLKEIRQLSSEQIKVLLDIIHADRELYRSGKFMDIVGSTAEKAPILSKLVRWGPAILWSKNIVVSTSNHPPYPVFIDLEGREINTHFSLSKNVPAQLYPLRLWLSEVILRAILRLHDLKLFPR